MYEQAFQNLLKSCLSFGGFLEERGPCENPVQRSMYEGHMEIAEYILLNIWCMLD